MITWFLIGLAIAVAAFAVVWAICLRVKNYSFLDVAWSYAVGVLALLYALVGPGHFERRLVVCGLGVVWSFRLGTHLFIRVLGHHPKEDVRYEGLRQRWPGPGMFLLFFELQAVIAAIFSLPFLLASWRRLPLQELDWIGLAISVLALAGEGLADRQMKRFKADPANRGGVCQIGLWRFSRHPNYFFEFLFWVGLSVASIDRPYGWITLICPLLMYHFLRNVTGIPITEEYSLKSRGDAYREYQRTTNAFWLGPRRKA